MRFKLVSVILGDEVCETDSRQTHCRSTVDRHTAGAIDNLLVGLEKHQFGSWWCLTVSVHTENQLHARINYYEVAAEVYKGFHL